MSLFTPSRQRLEITDAGATLLEQSGRGGWHRIGEVAHSTGCDDWAHFLDLLPALESSTRRAPMSVVIPDRWCKIYLTAPPSNAASLQDLRDAAAMRLRQIYDAEPQTYDIQFEPSATTPFACCAMQRSVVDRLREFGKASRTRIESIRPQYFEYLAGWRPRGAQQKEWFVSCDDASVTIGMYFSSRCDAIVQTRWADVAWTQPPQVALAAIREALRANVDQPATITFAGPPVRDWQRQRVQDMDLLPIALRSRLHPKVAVVAVPAQHSKVPA